MLLGEATFSQKTKPVTRICFLDVEVKKSVKGRPEWA